MDFAMAQKKKKTVHIIILFIMRTHKNWAAANGDVEAYFLFYFILFILEVC